MPHRIIPYSSSSSCKQQPRKKKRKKISLSQQRPRSPPSLSLSQPITPATILQQPSLSPQINLSVSTNQFLLPDCKLPWSTANRHTNNFPTRDGTNGSVKGIRRGKIDKIPPIFNRITFGEPKNYAGESPSRGISFEGVKS